jgi:hypothetical protein
MYTINLTREELSIILLALKINKGVYESLNWNEEKRNVEDLLKELQNVHSQT